MAENRPYLYDRPLTVQKVVDSPTLDELGAADMGAAATWEDYWNGFCRRLPRGGREYLRAVRIDAQVAAVLAVRYCAETAAIKPQSMRVQLLGRTLQISAVEDVDDAHREVLLTCTEAVEV